MTFDDQPSPIERLKLIQTLNRLMPEQLEEIIFTLNPPPGVIPPLAASQGQRVSALLNWAISPGGCGLLEVKQILDEIINLPKEIKLKVKKSALNIDHQQLHNLLQLKQWEEADFKTWSLILKMLERNSEQDLIITDFQKLSCSDLQIINQLWLETSQGRFGFSIQKQIWIESGGQADLKTVEKFGNRVGWRQEGQWIKYPFITFSEKALFGHLPLWRFGRRNFNLVYALMRKLADCKINETL